jgi:di- and tripeptidase
MLARLVSFPTVPEETHREDCRQASIYLKNTLKQLGAADAVLLSGAPGKNPLVLATFRAQQPEQVRCKRVLFYGATRDALSRLSTVRGRPADH